MDPRITDILNAVAEGRMDPTEAARLIDEAPTGNAGNASGDARITEEGAAAPEGVSGSPTASPGFGNQDAAGDKNSGVVPSAANGITSVHLQFVSYSVRVVADASVASVVVEGPHNLSQKGNTLVLTGDQQQGRFADGSYVMRGPMPKWQDVSQWFKSWGERAVTVRVNPQMLVDADLSAGTLVAEGVRLRKVHIAAGSVKLRGIEYPVDLLVQAGSGSVEARPTGGKWRMRVETGTLNLTLASGSSAKIIPEVQLGKVSGISQVGETVVGAGAAQLKLEVTMGNATVDGAGAAGYSA